MTCFRLTSLVFREECIVTACQDGYVCTWARPGTQGAGTVTALGGPPGPATGELGSPTQSNQVSQECILNFKCILKIFFLPECLQGGTGTIV